MVETGGPYRVIFLVPLREDSVIGNGQLHPPFRWKALEDALTQSFGGFTTPGGKVQGVWIDPKTKKPVKDTSREFQVDVDEGRLDEVRALVQRACRTFVQQCIRLVILGRAEYVAGGPDDEPL